MNKNSILAKGKACILQAWKEPIMKTKVFINGHEGTTGLRIHDRLKSRDDIELISIDDELRKDPKAVKDCLAAADIAFLCLPDGAAREAAVLAEDLSVRLIDTSTAHRTAAGWIYGFPELSATQRAAIAAGKRIANPGCHASGVIAAVQPLIAAGVMAADYPVTAYSLTGYSGGGRKMIEQYEGPDRTAAFSAPRQYGLNQMHKHLPEMKKFSGLQYEPAFTPVVADYYSGMEVTVPIFTRLLQKKVGCRDIWQLYSEHYGNSPFIRVAAVDDAKRLVGANALAGYDDMEILISGNDERIVITTLFDNLGKGASGAAIENMNYMIGAEATTGLKLHR